VDQDGPAVVLGAGADPVGIPLGTRWEFEPGMASAEVYRTGRPVRLDRTNWSTGTGPAAAAGGRLHIASQVQSPISVHGGLWGTISINSTTELPADTAERLERFTELVATAISNSEARAGEQRLTEEQAAL